VQRSFDWLRHSDALDEKFSTRTYGWLAMNRHYEGLPDHPFTSAFHADMPEKHHRAKHGAVDHSRVSYFFPEPRAERVALLTEIASGGAEVTLGFCRQPPMLSYHPAMCAAYQAETGVDPRSLDAEDGEAFLSWLRWRASFVTLLVADVRSALDALEAETGRHVRLAARLPADGLLPNLAQGYDLPVWVERGLIDELHLDPLYTTAGGDSLSLLPYRELLEGSEITLIGGVNSNGAIATQSCLSAFLRLAISLARGGVDGIEIFQTDNCVGNDWTWVMPLVGNPDRAEQLLRDSNLDACFPLDAVTVFAGVDNHMMNHRLSLWEGPAGPDLWY
jgi:hypothetical protein